MSVLCLNQTVGEEREGGKGRERRMVREIRRAREGRGDRVRVSVCEKTSVREAQLGEEQLAPKFLLTKTFLPSETFFL